MFRLVMALKAKNWPEDEIYTLLSSVDRNMVSYAIAEACMYAK